MEFVFDLFPQDGTLQGLFNFFRLIAFEIVDAQSERDIIEDAGREWVRLLKDHANKPAHGNRVYDGIIDVLPPIAHVAIKTKAAYKVIHSIQAAQHRALSASGRPNEGCDSVLFNGDGGIANCLESAVKQLFDLAINDHFLVGLRLDGGMNIWRVGNCTGNHSS